MKKNKILAAFVTFMTLQISLIAEETSKVECEKLFLYFTEDEAVIQSKIQEYKTKLKNNPKDENINYALGILYLAIGQKKEGNIELSEKAINYLERLSKEGRSDDNLLNAYYAMAWALRGRDEKNTAQKTHYAQKAIKIFDENVENSIKEDSHWYIRYLRANTYIRLPEEIFHKFNTAVEDYSFIEEYTYKKYDKRELKRLPVYMVSVFYFRGEIEKYNGKIDNAIAYWKKSVRLNEIHKKNIPVSVKAKKRISIFDD